MLYVYFPNHKFICCSTFQVVIARIPDAAPYRDKVESSVGVSIFVSELRNVIEMSTGR